MHFVNSADFTSVGNHSRSFQWPVMSPLIWPRRTITVGMLARSATVSNIFSATHFDSLYPTPSADEASMATSGMGDSRLQSIESL